MLIAQWPNKSFEWDVGYATAPPTPLKLGVISLGIYGSFIEALNGM